MAGTQSKHSLNSSYYYYKDNASRSSCCGTRDEQRLYSARTQVRSLAKYSGLKDLAVLQFQHKVQLGLRSDPLPRNSICCGEAKNGGKKKKRQCFQRVKPLVNKDNTICQNQASINMEQSKLNQNLSTTLDLTKQDVLTNHAISHKRTKEYFISYLSLYLLSSHV